MSEDLNDLHVITQARYQKAQSAMQAVQAEENKLRGLLNDLTEQEKAGRESMRSDSMMSMTGGDLAWNNWIGRNRKILNHQLANVLVRKEMAYRELQNHFGKADVMQNLLEDAEFKRRQLRQMALIESVMETKLSCG
ncbi:hypothetical protein J7413_09500 [Shimia sp. R10_1]|uniref:hypothetical protein n=1 Tax=Shimia sp. R10_1 TaxID=2821095 RepID=UPI001ADCBB9F|nr:hypothetical protein [Shimia sp. R10_1]MBO9473769.1 hypothetical protein [Shimia sp. R10_1]